MIKYFHYPDPEDMDVVIANIVKIFRIECI